MSHTLSPTQDTLLSQHASIAAAIAMLQSQLDDMTDSFDPEDVCWGDVSRYAATAECCRDIVRVIADDNTTGRR
jgi:hypothetical protein